MTIRTNAHPVVLTSTNGAAPSNLLLIMARECWDSGDVYGSAMELLYVTQNMRMAWDSPRIGGGVDPEIASGMPGWEACKEDSSLADYVSEVMELQDSADYVQDCIVHAEAVALRLIAAARAAGEDY